MHSNKHTLAPPELDQAIRDVFRTTGERLSELLPATFAFRVEITPDGFAFRVLRQAEDATDPRNGSEPLPTGPSVSSSATSASSATATPASSATPTPASSATPPASSPAIVQADGSTPGLSPAGQKSPRHRPPGPPAQIATGTSTPEVLGPDGAPVKR